MNSKVYSVLILLLSFSLCRGKDAVQNANEVRTDIRLGTKFYSIFLSPQGSAYVIKGISSYYTEPLRIESADTSQKFKIDSAKKFFERISKITGSPIFSSIRADAPRVEIYYNNKKIYDAYKWDETFWDLFRPIMFQIPKGFNPFRANDKPFEN